MVHELLELIPRGCYCCSGHYEGLSTVPEGFRRAVKAGEKGMDVAVRLGYIISKDSGTPALKKVKLPPPEGVRDDTPGPVSREGVSRDVTDVPGRGSTGSACVDPSAHFRGLRHTI